MSLDYPNTCPTIDKCITDTREITTEYISDLLSEACPLLPDDILNAHAESCASSICDKLEDIFETVRETNSDMRRVADDEISSLERSLDYLEDKIETKETKISILEDSVKRLEEILRELEAQIEETNARGAG